MSVARWRVGTPRARADAGKQHAGFPALWWPVHVIVVGLAAAALFLGVAAVHGPGGAWLDDYQSQYLPAFEEVGRAVRAARLPLRSEWSWMGGALAAELQYGVFSIVQTPLVALVTATSLTPAWKGVSLSAIYLAILAGGTALLLSRSRAPRLLSMAMALSVALQGHILGFDATSWFPALASFAWIPWLWLAMDWAFASPKASWRAAVTGLLLYLVMSAGWPFSSAAALLLMAYFGVTTCLRTRSLLPLWPLALAWLIGATLAAPTILSALEYLPHTARDMTGGAATDWIVPARALLGWFNPGLSCRWQNFKGEPEVATASVVFSGFLVPAGLIATGIRNTRILKLVFAELLLAVAVLALCLVPSVHPMRYSFRWIPFLTLVLAVATARLWERVEPLTNSRSRDPLATTAMVSAVGALVAAGLHVLAGSRVSASADLTLLAVVVVAIAWLLADRFVAMRLRPAVACAACVLAVAAPAFLMPNAYRLPAWRDLGTRTTATERAFRPDITYLAFFPLRSAYDEYDQLSAVDRALLPIGNEPMLRQVHFVNGYSPTKLKAYDTLLQMQWSGWGSVPRAIDREFHALTRLLGIDGLVLPEWTRVADEVAPDWQEVVRGERYYLIERKSKTPFARTLPQARFVSELTRANLPPPSTGPVVESSHERAFGDRHFGDATVELIAREPEFVRVNVRPAQRDRDVLVVFTQAYYPGMSAVLEGRELAVDRLYGLSPAVVVPAGQSGMLELRLVSSRIPGAFGVAAGGVALVLASAVHFLLARKRR